LLPLNDMYPVNFSGKWVFDEEMSDVGNGGTGNVDWQMEIDQDDDVLFVKRLSVVEWGEDRITTEEILLDGTEVISEVFNAPRISTANWDEDAQSIQIRSTVTFTRGGRSMEMKSSEEWSLREGGDLLQIDRSSTGFRGEENRVTLVYRKQL